MLNRQGIASDHVHESRSHIITSDKYETFSVSKLLIFFAKNRLSVSDESLVVRRVTPGGRIVVFFSTKHVAHR